LKLTRQASLLMRHLSDSTVNSSVKEALRVLNKEQQYASFSQSLGHNQLHIEKSDAGLVAPLLVQEEQEGKVEDEVSMVQQVEAAEGPIRSNSQGSRGGSHDSAVSMAADAPVGSVGAFWAKCTWHNFYVGSMFSLAAVKMVELRYMPSVPEDEEEEELLEASKQSIAALEKMVSGTEAA
jgi:hypothetical protein